MLEYDWKCVDNVTNITRIKLYKKTINPQKICGMINSYNNIKYNKKMYVVWWKCNNNVCKFAINGYVETHV